MRLNQSDIANMLIERAILCCMYRRKKEVKDGKEVELKCGTELGSGKKNRILFHVKVSVLSGKLSKKDALKTL